MNEHILIAYNFDGKGGGMPLVNDINRSNTSLYWIHLDACHPNTRLYLENEIADTSIIEALLAEETRPRMTPISDGALIMLRGVNLNEKADPEDMISIRVWIDDHKIISLRRRKLKATQDLKEKIELGKGPKNSGEFICMLTSIMFERMEPAFSALEDAVDDVEEKVLESADSSLRETIVQIWKQVVMFRRYMFPQKEAIKQLSTSNLKWLNHKHKRHLQETYNHVQLYVENLDALRERSQIVKDELTNILADKLNQNTYILSIIAAIFLPLSLLTGLLGVNLGGIPGADNPSGFLIFCGIMIVLFIIQIAVFKKLKWF